MKMNISHLAMMGTAVLLTACSNKEMFDENFVENSAKASYAENFVRKYANVNMNQSWDYSHKQSDYTLVGTNKGKKAATRAGEGGFTKGDWYEVDNNTLAWMQEKLPEGKDNRSLGNPFYMSVPGNEFTIVPIFQGQAGAMWNLHVVVDGVDYLVWEKINGAALGDTDAGPGNIEGTIQIKDLDNQTWHNMHGAWYDNSDKTGYDYWHDNTMYNTDGTDKWYEYDPSTDGWAQNKVTAVRAIPYTFKNLPVGAEMYFYLDITESGNYDSDGRHYEFHNVGTHESSLKGQMLALQDVPRPTNIPSDYEAMIISCEDADLADSDWDMNDLVLLVYGKTVPKPVKIEEGNEIEEVKTVRYMIEDLGSTDDFDFNDIVVDVSEIRTISPIYTNGVVTEWKEKGTRQEAVIRHLGGTLPFILTIGNTELEEHAGVMGSHPNERYEVSGWDMNRHNISIKVRQNTNSEVYNNMVFPKAGEAPMIIAVDPSQGWMDERQSVPESWFYVPEE